MSENNKPHEGRTTFTPREDKTREDVIDSIYVLGNCRHEDGEDIGKPTGFYHDCLDHTFRDFLRVYLDHHAPAKGRKVTYLEDYWEEDAKTIGVAFRVEANGISEVWALLIEKNETGRAVLPEGISFANITEKAAEVKSTRGLIKSGLRRVK